MIGEMLSDEVILEQLSCPIRLCDDVDDEVCCVVETDSTLIITVSARDFNWICRTVRVGDASVSPVTAVGILVF